MPYVYHISMDNHAKNATSPHNLGFNQGNLKPYHQRNKKNKPHGWHPQNGCFLKWWYPQIIHFNRVFHYKPSILGFSPYSWKHPNAWLGYRCACEVSSFFRGDLERSPSCMGFSLSGDGHGRLNEPRVPLLSPYDGGFLKIGGKPQNGGFIMETPIKNGWFGGTTI